MTASDPGVLDVDARVTVGAFDLTVTMRVEPGEVLAVVGPNGAGKTTLLRALAGLQPLAAGSIRLAGATLDDVAADVFVPASRREIGLVFQDYRLFPHLTVRQNLAFGLRTRRAPTGSIDAATNGWLDRLGLTGIADRSPKTISGGQAQRVALGRALVPGPALLLLDEPLAALDAGTRLDVRSDLRQHLTTFPGPTVLVTHDPLDALVLADTLLVLEEGSVVQRGSVLDVARRPGTDYVASLVGLNLLRATADGGVVTLDGGGSLTVPDHHDRGAVLVAIRPASIVVSTDRPHATSARNHWPAVVTGLSPLVDRVRISLDGQPPVFADVTPDAVTELDLRPGHHVWLSVKATEVDVYPVPVPTTDGAAGAGERDE